MKLFIATGIYPPDIGGPATYSKLLVDELSKRARASGQQIEVAVCSFGEVRSLPKAVRHAAYFFKVLWRAGRSDVIYAQDPVSVGLPALVAARLLGKKFLLKIVGDYAWEQGVQRFGVKENLDEFFGPAHEGVYSFPVRIFRWVESFVARHADRVIVPSNYLKKIVMRWGVPEGKLAVIYNAFEMDGPQESKERPQNNVQGKMILSVARLVPWKGLSLLISLMPSLSKQFPGLSLTIIGSGPEEKKLRQLISALDLSSSVTLLDRMPHEEVLRYITAADVFVLNTEYEGLSHLLLEVMALGTPLVTTSVGGNVELIRNGEEGILVGYNDRTELEKAIKKLLSDPLCAADHVAKAKKKVEQFSKERMFGDLIATLRLL